MSVLTIVATIKVVVVVIIVVAVSIILDARVAIWKIVLHILGVAEAVAVLLVVSIVI